MTNSILSSITFPILLIWELPQNLTGAIILLLVRYRKQALGRKVLDQRLITETERMGVSLGSFIFYTKLANRFDFLTDDCLMHEMGHSKQSRWLGPFYLLVVGIPSVIRVIYDKRYFKKHGHRWPDYYAGFPENWADRLGGITAGIKYESNSK